MIAAGIFFYSDKSGYKIGNRKSYGGKIVESVLVRDGKVVPFQYPNIVIAPSVSENITPNVSWRFSEEE